MGRTACYLTLAHSDEDFQFVADAFAQSVVEMQQAGLLPGDASGVAKPEFSAIERTHLTEAEKEVFYSAVMGDDANCAYNEANVMQLRGALDEGALRFALQRVLDRHSALRSRISMDGEFQEFASALSLELPVDDVSSLSQGEKDLHLADAMVEETETPFDLHGGPLIRFRLIRLADQHHVLLLTAHHIVCDGWSWGMLIDELSHLYNAWCHQQVCILPQPMSFADYARWLQSDTNQADHAKAEAFWLDRYVSQAPVLELPTDRPRPETKTFAAAMAHRVVDATTFAKLKSACPQLGGTMFTTLLALCGGLLHRITGQEDVVVGIPAAGQTVTGCDALIGHCLNFLPMRLSLEPEVSFSDLSGRVKNEVLEAYDHQNYTFGSLLRKLDLPRDTSRLPLVSVMFNIDRMGIDHLEFENLEIDFTTNPKQFTNFELFFNLVQTDDQLTIECEFNTDLFDRSTVDGWLAGFEGMMEAICEDASVSLGALPLEGGSIVSVVSDAWNDTAMDYPESPIQVLVSEVAVRTPDAVAVVCEESKLSYAELDQLSCGVSAELLASGVQAGDLVGIYMQRSVFMPVAMLAVMKAGAAYVPMDPDYPAQRIQWMVEDAKMSVVLTDDALASEVDNFGCRSLVVASVSPLSGLDSAPRVSMDDIAYVIFTSGSTGRPKGVRIPHRALTNFLVSMRESPGMTADDVLLAVTTLSFDIAGLEMFLPLLSGGQLVVAPRYATIDGKELLDLIATHGVTIMQATPVTWRLMLEAGWQGTPTLKVLCGGEAFPLDLAKELVPRSESVWNMYGPTETTIWSTVDCVSGAESFVSIGRPIGNTQIYILDDALIPVAMGQTGELYIGGDGLAVGYLDNPQMTAERFVMLPSTGARIYRTGDIARYMDDGRIECLGRVDHQVKLRGFRIELGDIESALMTHEAVKNCVVVAREDEPGNKQLVGYVVPENSKQPTDDAGDWQSQWEMLFTHALDEAESGVDSLAEIDSKIVSWAGGETSADQVREWIDTTVTKIRTLQPDRILEVGCGTGQLLLRLAPHATEYWGTDFAAPAIDRLRSHAGHIPGLKLMHRPADNFEGIPLAHFDTVVINSVIQYFPDADYLAQVVRNAIAAAKPGGTVFIGDIQSYALMECFHTTNQIRNTAGELHVAQLEERVMRRIARENELMVDPGFFRQFEAIPGVRLDVSLRHGEHTNETTAYHYDVMLHVGREQQEAAEVDWVRWDSDSMDWDACATRVVSASSDDLPIGIVGIPDARLAEDVALWRAVQNAEKTLPVIRLNRTPEHPGVSPETIWGLADDNGLVAKIRWGSEPGTLDVVFLDAELANWTRVEFPADTTDTGKTNQPNQGDDVLPSIAGLREHVGEVLPNYMVPSVVVSLRELPLTPNGKIDRKALPAPRQDDFSPQVAREMVAPRTPTETKLVELWRDTLGYSEISVTDSFFDIGGDSILSFKITARANAEGVPLTPRLFFQHKTIEAMAAAIEKGGVEVPSSGKSRITRVSRAAYRRK